MADVVTLLIRYHDYGEYEYEIRRVVETAHEYVEHRAQDHQNGKRLAAVFDIDETSLSNWPLMVECGFCSYQAQTKLYPHNAADPPIAPVLELYNFIKDRGITVFFITGRQESQRKDTEDNLRAAGYSGWSDADLIMQPDGNKYPASTFKPRDRQMLIQKGYTIILNIGDQASDLVGCCAERSFKLPNPFYLVQ